MLLLSCYSYSTLRIAYRVPCVPSELQEKYPASPREESVKNASASGAKQRIRDENGRCHSVMVKKYLARISSGEPSARIINRGVSLALKGQCKEAAILFEEVLRENADSGAALNNLGVLYELSGKREKAFELYSRACLLEPENEHFQHNLLYMVRHEGRGAGDETGKNGGTVQGR